MTEEIWKQIKDFPEYEVSNLGRIKSHFGDIERVLKPFDYEYPKVTLIRNKKRFNFKVHRLVLEAFVGLCPEGYEAHHKNDVKTDNEWPKNLEWISKGVHLALAYVQGLKVAKGEQNANAKLKDGEVWLIKKLLAFNIKRKLICMMFRISKSSLSRISTGRTWSHIKMEV